MSQLFMHHSERQLWHASEPGQRVLFVMLNPSIAGEVQNDPTIRALVQFAARWGYNARQSFGARFSLCWRYRYALQRDGLEVVNLFALRATDPHQLYRHEDPIGPDNDEALRDALGRSAIVVTAWGNGGHCRPRPMVAARARHVAALLRDHGVARPWCFGLTQARQPTHPLYQPRNIALERVNLETL